MPLVGEGERHHARQLVDAALARVVAGDAGDRGDAVDRAHVDDRAAAGRRHLARDRLADEERALEVDVDDGVPVGLGDVEELGGAKDAGVVDEDVDAAEGGDAGGERRVDLAAARDVAGEALARAPRGGELGGERPRRGGVDVPERDRGAARSRTGARRRRRCRSPRR